MKKSTIAKWVVASVAFTAVAAFTAGVIYELRAIKKLTLDIDNEEEPQAEEIKTEELTVEDLIEG